MHSPSNGNMMLLRTSSFRNHNRPPEMQTARVQNKTEEQLHTCAVHLYRSETFVFKQLPICYRTIDSAIESTAK